MACIYYTAFTVTMKKKNTELHYMNLNLQYCFISLFQVLGMSCVRDTFCQLVKGGTCGSGSVCVCSDGYTRDGHQCLQGRSFKTLTF